MIPLIIYPCIFLPSPTFTNSAFTSLHSPPLPSPGPRLNRTPPAPSQNTANLTPHSTTPHSSLLSSRGTWPVHLEGTHLPHPPHTTTQSKAPPPLQLPSTPIVLYPYSTPSLRFPQEDPGRHVPCACSSQFPTASHLPLSLSLPPKKIHSTHFTETESNVKDHKFLSIPCCTTPHPTPHTHTHTYTHTPLFPLFPPPPSSSLFLSTLQNARRTYFFFCLILFSL